VEQLADAVNQGSRGGSGAVSGGGRKRGVGGMFASEDGPKKKAKTKGKGKGKGVELASGSVPPPYGDGLESEREEEEEGRLEVETP
jgi:hypothetical protein